ncbi:MAG TPA: phenylacetic acid degradation bifunctional protein PaaZ [Gemmatimonadaceae bacterium]|nr:phenylacetic acid degradation bifunctional protein PaaZ [Gemmatimonadaceae bacterium]
MNLQNYALGYWVTGTGRTTELVHAVTGETIGATSSGGLDFGAMAEYGRTVGGPRLRAMTFHERARMLKALALYLMERKEQFYAISAATGATRSDSWIDIEGGIGTLFSYASRGRREFPDQTFYVDGDVEPLSKGGTFVGRHICVPLEGVAVHINAFNFPCWGMLEKLAPTWLAGVPAIVKPGTVTSYLTEAMVREIIASGIVPEGALQLICGSAGDLLSHLECQDVVAFTGSASTGQMLRTTPAIVENSVRFNMEADSLNCSILGPDATPGTPEFDLFVKEVAREMTIKAGQRCTAIRRTMVPRGMEGDVIKALGGRLRKVLIGDPAVDGVRMGPLVSKGQVADVGARAAELQRAGELVFGDDDFEVRGADRLKGAFFGPRLMVCDRPFDFGEPHDIEAFGPVNTVMPYGDVEEAIALARLGRGSLCGSLFTADAEVARKVVLGIAPYHGRLMVLDRTSAGESTGHGSALPSLVHGGPGRAGGGEEMGGVRGVLHYMQRSAVQGSPSMLTTVMGQWVRGAEQKRDSVHPFRKTFDELEIGETLMTEPREITVAEIKAFADLSGDHFYAHMDDAVARESIFGQRVAHGYFVLSAAAGLFVDPAPGPVLANYGLDNLRFVKPVYPGDTIHVRLTCKEKTAREAPREGLGAGVPQGVVAWDVEVFNQRDEPVALYTILTLVRRGT